MQVSCHRTNRKAPYRGIPRHEDVGLTVSEAEGVSKYGLARLARVNPVETKINHFAGFRMMANTECSLFRKSVDFLGKKIHWGSEIASAPLCAGNGIHTGMTNITDGVTLKLRCTQSNDGIIANGLSFSGGPDRQTLFKACVTERTMRTFGHLEKPANYPADPNPEKLS